MRGFSSPIAGYLLISGLVAASLVLATLADDKLGAPPSLGGSPLAGPAMGGNGYTSGGNGAGDATPVRNWREAPSAAPVVLTALMVGRSDAVRAALVAVNGSPAFTARPGDWLPGGYKVLALDAESLTYQDGERQVRVTLQDGTPAPRAMPIPLAAPAPTATAPQPETVSGNDAFRQAVEQRLASMRH